MIRLKNSTIIFSIVQLLLYVSAIISMDPPKKTVTLEKIEQKIYILEPHPHATSAYYLGIDHRSTDPELYKTVPYNEPGLAVRFKLSNEQIEKSKEIIKQKYPSVTQEQLDEIDYRLNISKDAILPLSKISFSWNSRKDERSVLFIPSNDFYPYYYDCMDEFKNNPVILTKYPTTMQNILAVEKIIETDQNTGQISHGIKGHFSKKNDARKIYKEKDADC